MSTVRVAIKEAMRLLKAIAPGDDPTVDELEIGLAAAQELILEIHEAKGPMLDIDLPSRLRHDCPPPTSGWYCPGEDQRVRVQAGFTATIELPNSVSMRDTYRPYDYGFRPSERWAPQVGSLGAADGAYWRAPRDGVRIEIVGTTQGLYFYRDDTNAWVSAVGLALDTELPLNIRLQGHFAAMLGERLFDVLSNLPAPTKAQLARVAHAREAIFTRPGVHRAPVRAQYL